VRLYLKALDIVDKPVSAGILLNLRKQPAAIRLHLKALPAFFLFDQE
jgi:hypothetical protein